MYRDSNSLINWHGFYKMSNHIFDFNGDNECFINDKRTALYMELWQRNDDFVCEYADVRKFEPHAFKDDRGEEDA